MNRLATILLAGALACAPVLASAQATGPGPITLSPLPYRILDQDRLLRGSRLGQEILSEIRAAEIALEAENQQLFDQLAAEERALTEARASLSADEFRARADAFDTRVETVRAERQQVSQELTRNSEAEAQRFFDTALPILVRLMNEEGIVALLKPETLILGSDLLDITDEAIARLDAIYAQAPGQDAPAPQPESPQPDAPQPDAPLPESPQPEAPQPDAPQPELPQPDAPQPDAPQPDTPAAPAPPLPPLPAPESPPTAGN